MTTRILAYETWSDGDLIGIHSSDDQLIISSDPAELLEFLRYKASGVLRIFWDLDESLAPVLRLLPRPILESLARFDENTEYCGHQLYYLPERSLRVGRARLYGIKSFWPSDTPAPTDLQSLQDMADELISTLERCGMPDPIKLTSPIAVFEGTEKGQQAYSLIPRGHDLTKSTWGALEYAFQADRREWITAYQLGHWGESEIFDFDVSSQYPSCAAELLDIRDMEAWRSESIGIREQKAYYGVLRGRLYIDPSSPIAHASPFMADLERMPGNPAGDFGDGYHITLDEYRLLEQYPSMGEFTVESGWFLGILGGVRPRKPFYNIMHELFDMRAISDLAASSVKGIANQIIGKLIETRVDGTYGQLRNDLYHALILAQARCKVSQFLLENNIGKDELVVVQTDGCRLTREVKLYGKWMGAWRCNGSFPTIVASPYKVYCGDKKPGHLTYEMVTDMVKEHPLSQYYGTKVKHRMTMRQALSEGDISRVGELVDMPAHLDMVSLQREQNRLFKRMPQTGMALLGNTYQSEAVVIG
jgi:hypothetical protein